MDTYVVIEDDGYSTFCLMVTRDELKAVCKMYMTAQEWKTNAISEETATVSDMYELEYDSGVGIDVVCVNGDCGSAADGTHTHRIMVLRNHEPIDHNKTDMFDVQECQRILEDGIMTISESQLMDMSERREDMRMNSCNCTLRAVTGDTKCCENCTNNTLRTIYGNTRIDIGVPVIHGHWIEEKTYDLKRIVKCSVCRQNHEFSNYCPNCGARMDESGGARNEID